MRRSRAAWRPAAALAVLVLAGCASGGPAPVEDRGAGAATVAAGPRPPPATPPEQPEQPEPGGAAATIIPLADAPPADAPRPRAAADAAAPPAAPAPPANPAVVALLNRANQDAGAGRHDNAAASLERALKIEPGNAWLWHRLAQARLAQQRAGEAAALAAKSNTLAGSDSRLQAENWLLIARVHRGRGEAVAAEAAERRARELLAPAS